MIFVIAECPLNEVLLLYVNYVRNEDINVMHPALHAICITNIFVELSTKYLYSSMLNLTKINPKSLMCTFQWRNRAKHNLKLNLLAIITFDKSD